MNRRRLLAALAALSAARPALRAARGAPAPRFTYPMALPGKPPGDGFYILTGYACENLRYYPGLWHTGENWFALDGPTFGLPVHAVGDGQVVFAGYDYPGPVVIIQHAPDLFSMYGHLDYTLAVAAGDQVKRGDRIGAVLQRPDDAARSHLHFELRTFLTTPEVNGDAPRYGFTCGYDCPPGPGYWPRNAPEHPSAIGWRNPTHVIGRRAFAADPAGAVDAVVVDQPFRQTADVWNMPGDRPNARTVGTMSLTPGARLPLLAIRTGAEDSTGTSADATSLWYRVTLPGGNPGWVQAAVPDAVETGADGRPSAVRLDLAPDVAVS